MKLPPALLLLAALAATAIAQEPQEDLPPGPPTYAAIDSALEEELLLPLGATWRYFRGVAEPSEGLEWTERGFDDSEWLEGPSPLGWGHEDNATKLDGIEPPVTTLYLRAFVSLADPEAFESIHLEMPIDDGFVCWLDGTEADRLHAGHPGAATAFDKHSTWPRTVDLGPLPIVDLTDTLQPGDSCVAIQALTYKDDVESLSVRPLLRARYEPNARAEEKRYEEYARRLKAEGAVARGAYLEGRHLQRTGRSAEAAAFFLKAAELDPEARLPWARLIESHREAGSLAEFATVLDERVASGATTAALLDAWARLRLEDLGGSPVDLVELAADAELPEQGFFADAYFAGSQLLAGQPLRIDAGADEDHGANGQTWSRDRFAAQGRAEAWNEDKTPFRAVRICDRAPFDLEPVYRVPLPDGTYLFSLYLASAEPHQFDVFLDGARVRAEFDPTSREMTAPLNFPVRVTDGFLELDVFPRTGSDPRIAGFGIDSIETERFEELARSWAEETRWHQAFPIVQLAEAQVLAGDLRIAFDFYEQASLLLDFRPADQVRMALVEDELLPELLSYEMADDLIARRGVAAAAELLPAIKERAAKVARRSRAEAAWDDQAAARALYYEGRLHQVEGRLNEAIIAFEELAFSGRHEPEPLQRFAECLIESHLLPEAEGLIREGLFGEVPASPELLRLWISLNLDELEGDAWELVADLSALAIPDELVVVPTSETVGQDYAYLGKDPPSTTWSRPNFDASTWAHGPGGLGRGLPDGGVVRSSWETNVIFARRPFHLPGTKLLYPHARAAADDAGDVYLNGTMVSRISARTDGYVDLPVRKGSFENGLNFLGIYAINYRGPGYADVGIVEPLGDLVWVLNELEEHDAIRINCGGEDYEAADGTRWSRDRFFGYALYGGAEDQAEIEDAEYPDVYLTQSSFGPSEIYTAWYQIPLPDGDYIVTLHFAEFEERDPEEKPHPFTVQLEKADVLTDHDVIASAGAHLRAEQHTFEVTVTDGWLDVDFKYKQHAFLNGIEVVRE